MDRLQKVMSVWNWLPAFRAVAEVQQIHAAAKRLHVSPSALSRTVRLLEDAVGQPLFDRVGRSLRLNASGEELLHFVRDAVRGIDDGLSAMAQARLKGSVYLSSPLELASSWIGPAVKDVAQRFPGLTLHLRTAPPEGLADAILTGDVDLALAYQVRARKHVQVERLCSLDIGVYCGAQHPLYRQTPSAEDLLRYPFVAIEPGLEVGDGWPTELERKVALYVPTMDLAAQLCGSQALLAVLPVCLPLAAKTSHTLHRLPFAALPSREVFAAYRAGLDQGERAGIVLQAVRAYVDVIEGAMDEVAC
jgi:DNA-binding transcriptional LysR family regulator